MPPTHWGHTQPEPGLSSLRLSGREPLPSHSQPLHPHDGARGPSFPRGSPHLCTWELGHTASASRKHPESEGPQPQAQLQETSREETVAG